MEYYKNYSLESITYIDDEGIQRTEQWKDIIGYEGYYHISDLGRVKRIKRTKWSEGKILKQSFDKDGYLDLQLCAMNKRTWPRTHRLVALAFIPNPLNLPEVNHRFGIKTDNRVSQLEWITQRDNQRHKASMANSASKHIGVYWNKTNKNWRSVLVLNKKHIEVGSFKTEIEAANAYNIKYNELVLGIIVE